MTSMATAAINEYEKTPQGYVVFHIEVGYGGLSWDIKRRFNDFVALHHDLCRELKSVDLGELPRKRFFGRTSPVNVAVDVDVGMSRVTRPWNQSRMQGNENVEEAIMSAADNVIAAIPGDFCDVVMQNHPAISGITWFDPVFLEERQRDLQNYLSNVLNKVQDVRVGAISDFLEINEHLSERMDIDRHPYVFIAEQEEMEQKRLAALVENFASAMIDSSSVGVEPRGDAEVEAQREKLLKACNGFSAFDEHLKGFFNGPVPSETEWDTADEMVEEMCNIPNVSVRNQLKATNAGTIDGFVTPVILENGQSLVCHMHSPSG